MQQAVGQEQQARNSPSLRHCTPCWNTSMSWSKEATAWRTAPWATTSPCSPAEQRTEANAAGQRRHRV